MPDSARAPARSRRPWHTLTAALALLAGLLPTPPAVAVTNAAVVVRSSGDTWLIREGVVATPLTDAYALRAGDRLSTGATGRLRIRYQDGTVMAMGPDTSLTIDRYNYQGRQSESWFSMARGTLRTITGAIGKLNAPGFKLRTPTAVMGVRGTDFTVLQRDCRFERCDAHEAPPTELRVHSGRVVMATRRGEIEVPEGRRAVVGGSNTPPQLAVHAPPRTSGARAPGAHANEPWRGATRDSDRRGSDRRGSEPRDSDARQGGTGAAAERRSPRDRTGRADTGHAEPPVHDDGMHLLR